MIQWLNDSVIQLGIQPTKRIILLYSGILRRGSLPVTFGLEKRLNLWFFACYTS